MKVKYDDYLDGDMPKNGYSDQQSQQAKIDELENKLYSLQHSSNEVFNAMSYSRSKLQDHIDALNGRINELEKHLAIVLDEYYLEGCFSTKICNEAEKALNNADRLNDSWYVKHVKPFNDQGD